MKCDGFYHYVPILLSLISFALINLRPISEGVNDDCVG